jgi:hypothetical protein
MILDISALLVTFCSDRKTANKLDPYDFSIHEVWFFHGEYAISW